MKRKSAALLSFILMFSAALQLAGFRQTLALERRAAEEPGAGHRGVEITKKVAVMSPDDPVAPPGTAFQMLVTADGVPYAGEYNIGLRVFSTPDGIISLLDGETAVIGDISSGTLVEVSEINIPAQFVHDAAASDLSPKTTADGAVVSFTAVNRYSPDDTRLVSGFTVSMAVVGDDPAVLAPPDTAFQLLVTVGGAPYSGAYTVDTRMLSTSDGIIRLRDGETAVFNRFAAGVPVRVDEINIPENFVLNLTESDLSEKTTIEGVVIFFTAVNHFSSSNPKTGDMSEAGHWLLIVLVSAGLMLLARRRRKTACGV